MKIKKVIRVFEEVLKYYEKFPNGNYYGICGIAWKKIQPSKRTDGMYQLFNVRGYYQNFIRLSTGRLLGPSRKTIAGTAFRIAFLKQEIIELQNLLSEGYTDI